MGVELTFLLPLSLYYSPMIQETDTTNNNPLSEQSGTDIKDSLVRTTQEINLAVSTPDEVDAILQTATIDALQAGEWKTGQQLMDVQRIFSVITRISTSKIDAGAEERTTSETAAMRIGDASSFIHNFLSTRPHLRDSYTHIVQNAPGITPQTLVDMVDTVIREERNPGSEAVETEDPRYQKRAQIFMEAKLLVANLLEEENRLASIFVWNKNEVPQFPKAERPFKIMLTSEILELRKQMLEEAAESLTNQPEGL